MTLRSVGFKKKLTFSLTHICSASVLNFLRKRPPEDNRNRSTERKCGASKYNQELRTFYSIPLLDPLENHFPR